jgi:hypothetical protein
VSSVNIEYSNKAAEKLKALKGCVSQWANIDGEGKNGQSTQTKWEEDPPSMIKCYQGPWTNQRWEPWDEHLPEALIENGAQGISRSYHRGAAAPLGELARRT